MSFIEKHIKSIIIVLTALLALTGGYIYLFGESADFEDVRTYEAARADGTLSHTAPLLPECATDIDVVIAGSAIEEISFLCADRAMRTAFVDEVSAQFEWNISVFEENEVTMRRVK